MRKLFVEKSIEINAPASRVWEVLTNPDLTKAWIKQWWPDLRILESDWKSGSPMLWRLADGIIGAEGTVSMVEPYTMLRFSFKVNDPTTSKQEDLTYRLEERDGQTKLSVSVGDFGDTLEHELCYPGAVEAWNRSLPKIKELAEK
jgi:uncharacterized protein YndB with AHSA1/START domain